MATTIQPPATPTKSAERYIKVSSTIVNLVTGRHLEPIFKEAIRRGVQGLPIQAMTARFFEAANWFFGTGQFGHMIVRDLLDRHLPDEDDFRQAFRFLAARVLHDSIRPLEQLLASNAVDPSPHKVLKLKLDPPGKDLYWSALVNAVDAYARRQAEREDALLTTLSSSPPEKILLGLQSQRLTHRTWSIHQLELSPVGQQFARILREYIYDGVERSIIEQLNNTPKRKARRASCSGVSQEELKAEQREQAQLFKEIMEVLVPETHGPIEAIDLLIQRQCSDNEAARDCCTDLVLLFIWFGLLNRQNPI